MKKKIKRLNIYFRQTAKSFRAARQTQIFSHINRNLPYRIFQFSKSRFSNQVMRIKGNKDKFKERIPHADH